jgi:GTP pyrophosphokinase
MPKIKDEIDKLHESDLPEESHIEQLSKVKIDSGRIKSSGGIIIDGEAGCQVKFAKCCNPLPGDRIVGFITRGFGVSVHKADCPNVIQSRANEDNLARWVKAEWEKTEANTSSTYEAKIQILCEDGIGVLAGISVTLADMKVSISQINTQMSKDGTIIINIVVGCKNVSHYDAIVARLRSVPKVLTVTRSFSS